MSTNKLEYIVKTFRQHKADLPYTPVPYTAIFRTRESIDVSDGLWTGPVADTVAGISAGRPWRSRDRVREVFGAESPATPPKS